MADAALSMQECQIQENVPLAPATTTKLGGPARYWAIARSVDQLRFCLDWGRRRGVGVQVLGGGSNVLFADAGFDGLVVNIGVLGVSFSGRDGTVMVRAAAGEDWDGMVAACVARGLGGIECLSGIPGLVGATPIQNVGAYGQEVAETIATVHALDRTSLEVVAFAAGECDFAYRNSRFKGSDRGRFVVTGVDFRLQREGVPRLAYRELEQRLEGVELAPGRVGLEAVRDGVVDLRRGKSMVVDAADPNSRSVGSFFLNPVLDDRALAALERRWKESGGNGPARVFPAAGGHKVAAAWLVEAAGYQKGLERDGVAISANHALALVNRGGTTMGMLLLADEIAAAVERRFGVTLEREPVVV